jgi:hypothetical protein
MIPNSIYDKSYRESLDVCLIFNLVHVILHIIRMVILIFLGVLCLAELKIILEHSHFCQMVFKIHLNAMRKPSNPIANMKNKGKTSAIHFYYAHQAVSFKSIRKRFIKSSKF